MGGGGGVGATEAHEGGGGGGIAGVHEEGGGVGAAQVRIGGVLAKCDSAYMHGGL